MPLLVHLGSPVARAIDSSLAKRFVAVGGRLSHQAALPESLG